MEGINKPTHYVNMPLVQALQDSTAMACIHRSKLPSEQDFSQYQIELVVEEYSNEEDEKAEVCFMEFIHRTIGQVYRVNILDVGKSLNAFHFLNWHCDRNNRKWNFQLGGPIGVNLTLNCMDYFKPESKVYWMTSFREEALEKLVSLEPIDEEVPSAQEMEQIKAKRAKLRAESLKNTRDIQDNGPEDGNCGSDLENPDSQQDLKQRRFITKKAPVSRQIVQENDPSVMGYSEISKLTISLSLIQYLKVKENRFKKIAEIRDYFLTQKYHIPEKAMKELLREVCVSSAIDRVNGFRLLDNNLSAQEKAEYARQKELAAAASLKKPKRRSKKGMGSPAGSPAGSPFSSPLASPLASPMASPMGSPSRKKEQ